MVEPHWTAWGVGLTLPASAWLTLWMAFLGVFAAYFVGRYFEGRRDKNARAKAFSQLQKALTNLKRDLLPFYNWKNDFETRPSTDEQRMAAAAIINARSALIWVSSNPALFEFEDWTTLHQAEQILEAWLCARRTPEAFISQLLRGQIDDREYIRQLARDIDDYLAEPWVTEG